MGARTTSTAALVAEAARLKGTRIVTDMVTVTGTENLMMAATLAEGETVIENAAREPERSRTSVQALDAWGRGSRVPAVTASSYKASIGCTARAHAHARSDRNRQLPALWRPPAAMSCRTAPPGNARRGARQAARGWCDLDCGDDWIRIRMNGCPRAVSLRTAPYPAFPIDMQAQFMALNSIADGVGRVTETIFENRFMHVLSCNGSAQASRSRAIPRWCRRGTPDRCSGDGH
jgi:UDP-N-acetylglucosamine 1-carboxyvinyltransferase